MARWHYRLTDDERVGLAALLVLLLLLLIWYAPAWGI
jgi:hypothetical protein